MPDDLDIQHTLATLVAKDEITNTVIRLFTATDARDWETVRAVLAPMLRVDTTSLTGGEPTMMSGSTLVTSWDEGLQPILAIHHQVGNLQIKLLGGTAEAHCYGIATHYRPTRSGRNVRTFVGSYDFELRQMDGAWRITLFRFNLKYLDGNLDLEND